MNKKPKKPARRTTPLEREVRLMRKQFDRVLALQATNAELAAHVRRLLTENDTLRGNRILLVREIESLKGLRVAA